MTRYGIVRMRRIMAKPTRPRLLVLDAIIDPITKQAIIPIIPMMETIIPSTDKKDEAPSKFK